MEFDIFFDLDFGLIDEDEPCCDQCDSTYNVEEINGIYYCQDCLIHFFDRFSA